MTPHIIFIFFLFALGACIGSFLNVVVWRLPRGESLIRPPSHCPNCQHLLAWRDNIPVFGWILLAANAVIAATASRLGYPIVEAITGLLFAGYYVCFFILQIGPCPAVINAISIFGTPTARALTIQQDWPIYLTDMFLIAALLAASLIDAELFIIPPSIPWWAAGVGLVVHAIVDQPTLPGAVNASPPGAAFALGGGAGLIISIILLRLKILPLSFEEGTPELDVDKERPGESRSNRRTAAARILPERNPRGDAKRCSSSCRRCCWGAD